MVKIRRSTPEQTKHQRPAKVSSRLPTSHRKGDHGGAEATVEHEGKAPKARMTSYHHFLKERLPEIKKTSPYMKAEDKRVHLGQLWSRLSTSEKVGLPLCRWFVAVVLLRSGGRMRRGWMHSCIADPRGLSPLFVNACCAAA